MNSNPFNLRTTIRMILATTSLAAVTAPAYSQSSATPAPSSTATTAATTANTTPADDKVTTESGGLDEIVVTASTGDKTKLRSSISVTEVPSDLVQAMAPRSQAEVLRLIPGMIIADTAGPGGNNNFSVRGLPVTTGGAPFIQIQEDGLPTVLFGDMNFGNNDYWTRFDVSNTVESVRGGSASTLASQAPGAVINYISATGAQEGGEFTLSEGLGFQESKITFAYGAPISDTMRFHVDGFYVKGYGLRDQGFPGEDGYQIKANLTKDLPDDKGYIRFYFKRLDDEEPYTAGGPALVSVSGNNLSNLATYPGFDSRTGTTVGVYNTNFNVLNSSSGTFSQVKNDGIHPIATAFGAELHFTPGGNITLDDKFRYTQMSGTFAAQFLGLTNTAGIIGSSVNGQTVGKVVYADGPLAGQAYSGNVNNSAQIYTQMSNMGSTVNDLSLADKWETGFGKFSVKGGVFYMDQNIDQNWHPNDGYQVLSGHNAANLNLISTTGQLLSERGVTGYNSNWGASVDRTYELSVADTAPYLDLTWDLNGLQLEGSFRQDDLRVTGWTESASEIQQGYLTNTTLSPTGTLNTPYVSYATLDPSTYQPIDYGFSYRAWSMGALYQFDPDTSAFVRASRGGKANTDRNLFSGYNNADGGLNPSGQQKTTDIILQQEVGLKNKGSLFDGNYSVEATIFHNSFGVSNFDLTQAVDNRYFVETYSAKGLEFEASYRLGGFSLNTQVTYTDAKVNSNEQGPDPQHLRDLGSGYLPGGTPKVTFVVAPTYRWNAITGGFVVQGQSKENLGNAMPFYAPAQYFVDAFGSYDLGSGVSVGLHANNVFNKIGTAGGSNASSVAALQAQGTINGKYFVTAPAEFGRAVTADITVRF